MTRYQIPALGRDADNVPGDDEMTTTLSLDELRALRPCDPGSRIKLFAGKERLSVAEALDAGATISDICWVAGKLGKKRECVQFALECAKLVAHLNPDPRVQAALDATQAWLDNPCEETAGAANAAARAAYANAAKAAAAYAANAAARAANAAGAAARAAYAAGVAGVAGVAAIREIAIRVFA